MLMKLTDKQIKTYFPSARINISSNLTYTSSIDICDVIPFDDSKDKCKDIDLREFVRLISMAVYLEGVRHGEENIKDNFKKLLGL